MKKFLLSTVTTLLFCNTLILQAQEAKTGSAEPVDRHNADPAKSIKYESGDVTVNQKNDATRLKDESFTAIRKMKLTLENEGKKDVLDNYTAAYAQGFTVYQKGDYIQARREFSQLLNKIEAEAKVQADRYKSLYDKYTAEGMQLTVQRKLENPKSGLEQYVDAQMARANSAYSQADYYVKASKALESISLFKSAIRDVLLVHMAISKDINAELTNQERVEKELIMDVDYLKKEYVKDFDDANGKNHAQETASRAKDREATKNAIAIRQQARAKFEQRKNSSAEPKEETKKPAGEDTAPAPAQ